MNQIAARDTRHGGLTEAEDAVLTGFIESGVFDRELLSDRLDLRLSGRVRDALCESTHNGDATPTTPVEQIAATGHQVGLHRHGHEEIWHVDELASSEAGRCDTNDGVCQPIEHYVLADDIRITREPPSPHTLSEHHLWVRTGTLIYVGGEEPADVSGNTHHVEVGRSHHCGADRFRRAVCRRIDLSGLERRHALERAVAFTEIEIVHVGGHAQSIRPAIAVQAAKTQGAAGGLAARSSCRARVELGAHALPHPLQRRLGVLQGFRSCRLELVVFLGLATAYRRRVRHP